MQLDVLDGDGSGGVAGLRGVVAAADDVIAAIDQKDIVYTLAVKCPEETPGEGERQGWVGCCGTAKLFDGFKHIVFACSVCGCDTLEVAE